MNSTNRGLNRFFILLVGLLLIAAGGAVAVLGAVPAVASQAKSIARQLASGAQPWVADPTVGKASLLVLGIALVALVLIVLLLVFIGRQGHGRSAAALRQGDGAMSTRVDLAIPRALLEEHLSERDELAGLRISAYEVRGTPMLKITARCRRGVSPAEVSTMIGRAVDDLERIIGTDVPTFVQLTGGFRAGSAMRSQVA
ncbi:hypothetical protein [Amnibacterium kyonggiense]|uniref:Uncharacterized protein n=1 Tax=Amnibacterium kyonggiense TaxID=595671 RepID=A0A4V3EBI4_9MICO|nr:hypothetical protein [Amnibacterium kyonggiense]TDS80784.1 hypothetical protein CLV52_1353 [Amnibacterium kyonggiense]